MATIALSMKGAIRTREKCPCGGRFAMVRAHGRQADLVCSCGRRPHYFYIDARDMKAGKIYRNKNDDKFDSFLAAQRFLEVINDHIDRHIFDPRDWMPSRLKARSLGQMSEEWLDSLKAKSFSYQRHARNDFEKHIIPAIGEHFDIRELRTMHSEAIMKAMEGLAPKTIKNALVTFQTFCNWLHYLEHIERVPRIPRVKVPQSPRSWIDREKQGIILNNIHERDRLIFETLIETAARPGEVCALKAQDLIDGVILIERAFDERGVLKPRKQGKAVYRAVGLDLYRRLLARSQGLNPGDWLFKNRWDKPYTRNGLYRRWKRAAGKAKITIDLYRGTRTSWASQRRLEKEQEVAEAIRRELGNAETITPYARDRREKI